MMTKRILGVFVVSIGFLSLCSQLISAQEIKKLKTENAFNESIVKYSATNRPVDIKLPENSGIANSEYFSAYREAFDLAQEHSFEAIKQQRDQQGTTHTRYKQYYKGIELAERQYLLHSKNDRVYHAHGRIIHLRDFDVTPSLSLAEATALVKQYMGEDILLVSGSKMSGKKSMMKNNPLRPTEKTRLVITSEKQSAPEEDFRLAYRFDVVTLSPLGRYFVDIDSKTGDLLGQLPQAYTENIVTKGVSLFNDTVDITIVDEYRSEDWEFSSFWHLDDWMAYGGSGLSWWLADTSLGINGGYDNGWYEVLDSDPVYLSGTNIKLKFVHRYALESFEDVSEEGYDGWDGINVRISTDGGESWEVLQNPTPAYSCTSLFSFGYQHGEGPGVPGWGGVQNSWTNVTFSLNSYVGDTVMIRFAFASDPGWSTIDEETLFGWQIDNIEISNNSGTLFASNNGTGIEEYNLFRDSKFIDGNFRLRETSRGDGIVTINGLGGEDMAGSVDFVEDDSLFDQIENKAGVSLHWAMGKTYDYFLDRHGRKSYDDEDSRIYGYANWTFSSGGGGSSPNNAMWSGNMALFGGGDGTFYESFGTLDITGHEIAHGVTQYSAGLVYQNESGALNESFSDIFGAAIEFYTEGDEADWIIGEDNALLGNPIRSMSNPKIYGDPDTYRGENWESTDGVPTDNNDYGGVHTNSGVQNYWFYLLSEGGSGINDQDRAYDVEGIGIEDAEKIAYHTLTNYLFPLAYYADAAQYSITSAADLFGSGSTQYESVIDAWEAVGITQYPTLVVPDELEISTLPGESTTESVLIVNAGIQELNIDDVVVSGQGFSISGINVSPLTVTYSSPFSFNVRFWPTNEDPQTGSITISSNDPNTPLKTINLSGVVREPDALIEEAGYSTQLLPAYPNPFSTSTQVNFSLESASNVTIIVYNLQGQRAVTLSQQFFEGGKHSISWDGTNDKGNRVSPGIYIIEMQLDGQIFTERLSVL